jgi:hypothetical protein
MAVLYSVTELSVNSEATSMQAWHNLTYYPGMCVEELRKITKPMNQDIRLSGRKLRPGTPEYETGFSRVIIGRRDGIITLRGCSLELLGCCRF